MNKETDFRDSNCIAVLSIDALYFFNTNDFDANVVIYTENVNGSLINMRLHYCTITTIKMSHI